MVRELRLIPCSSRLTFANHQLPRSVACRVLCGGVQSLKKCHERRGLCRAQIVPVCGHVAASLNHLANELVLRKARGDAIESRSSFSARVTKRVAVAALLHLKYQSTLPLECGR